MNNRVAGKIFVEGTARGIGDLLIVLYDLDPGTIDTIRAEIDAVRPDTVASVDDAFDAQLKTEMRFWADIPGDRLGSVLTDARGHFDLVFDDQAFQVRNSEKRPDLLLMVLGPDRGVGSHPLQTLLHYTFVPRANAGRVEHYIIAISAERLAEKGVVITRAALTTASVQTERKRAAERDEYVASLNAFYRERVAIKKARKEKARAYWGTLNDRLRTKDLVSSRLFVRPGESHQVAHEKAVRNGINWLSAARPSHFRLFFSPEDLLSLGLGPDINDSGEDISVPVCDLLARKGLGTELTRVRSLLDDLRERRRQRQLSQIGSPTPSDTGNEDDDGPAPLDEERREFVSRRVLGQIAELPQLERDPSRSTMEELAKIKDTINRLELASGPANVTAFHDFHTLQVAFEDVWTAAFDNRLRDQVMDLYRQTVVLHEDYGLQVPPLEDVADANALREYLAILRGELAEVELSIIPGLVNECFPQLDLKTWNQLTESGRNILTTAAGNFKAPWSQGNDIDEPPSEWSTQEYLDNEYDRAIRFQLNSPLARAERLTIEIADKLSEPHSFKYYAPGTINYAILVTYRQEWIPETYQVGRLLSTVPLAPGEERKLKVSRKIKKSRAEKAVEKALLESSQERKFTSRAELDVMAKVSTTTNFQLSATGSFNIGIGQISSTSQFSHNQQHEASRQKKQFLEAVQQASERVRQESEIEIQTNDEIEEGVESDTVLKNPNNELTVTYLLYELERRYRVTSRPHRLTPAVLVALDIPAPHEITEAWILEHAWILRRILLADQFIEAIDYIENGLSGDSVEIEVLKASWDGQREALTQLESDFERLIELRNTRQTTIVDLLEKQKLAEAKEMDDGQRAAAAIFTGGLSELFGSGTSDRDEIAKARREAAEKALEFLQTRVEALSERVALARKSAAEAAAAYSEAIQHKATKDTRIRQLQLHLRQNILHYMRGIWDYKDPDQRFFELNDLEVPFLEPATRRCRLRRPSPAEVEQLIPGITRGGEQFIVECDPPQAPPTGTSLPTRRLGAIADLDRPLGYKGNYVIFPLKTCTYLTDYMGQSFVDDYFGLKDPSTDFAYTGEELLSYAGELLADSEATLSEEERTGLIAAVTRYLSLPSQDSERVVLPTGQLYMEALKGEQTLLEDFKLAHRGLDVLKAQEEVRAGRLENLRKAARLLADIPFLEDPDVEKSILIRGPDDLTVAVDSE